MSLRRAAAARETRTPLPVLIPVIFIGIVVLMFAGWKAIAETNDAAAFGHAIRDAQTSRAQANNFQLREDAGIRGYAGTGSVFLLRAFTEAAPKLGPSFNQLNHDLALLGIETLVRTANDEEIAADRWNATIAQPLLRDRRLNAAALGMLLRGETFMARFRADNFALRDGLNAAAAAADGKTQHALGALVFFMIATLLALVAGSVALIRVSTGREGQRYLADTLQKALQNRTIPIIPGLLLHAVYVPATRHASVGGDWHDTFELPDKRVMFAIGDVAGHGVQAATVMSQARQAIIAAALHETDPARVLMRANDSIVLQEGQMVTAICGFIDPHTHEIRYATAGHPAPMLLAPDRDPEFLPHDGIPLGIFGDATYRSFRVQAVRGTILVLYTDGIIEQYRDVIAGQDRLLEAARFGAGAPDPALAIYRYVFNDARPLDDVAILAITLTGTANQDQPPGVGLPAEAVSTSIKADVVLYPSRQAQHGVGRRRRSRIH